MASSHLEFPPFRLDLSAGLLTRDGTPVPLRRRTWDVLAYLARNPGRLVTKAELLEAVWSDAVVTEGTLSNSIRELRAALGDAARAPRYIETVHRRGFRFLVRGSADARADATSASPPDAARPRRPRIAAGLVGRVAELAALEEAFRATLQDGPRIAFVRGEAGIGKSALVDGFLERVQCSEVGGGARTVVGRCTGFLHGAPPFYPLLDALERLATPGEANPVAAVLADHAPEILAQLPWLADGLPPPPTAARSKLSAVPGVWAGGRAAGRGMLGVRKPGLVVE